MHKLLSNIQGGFITGKQISDFIRIAHEAFCTIDDTNIRYGLFGMILDLDKVNWQLLFRIMKTLGAWLNLLQSCVDTTKIGILVNAHTL